MGKISEGLFEYLFRQTTEEKRPLEEFVNRRDNRIYLLRLKGGQYCFLLDGELKTNIEGDIEGHRTDNMLIVEMTDSGKRVAIPRGYISKIEEEFSLDEFVKETQELYLEILKSQTAEEPELARRENRRQFGKLLSEAAEMELSLQRRKNEDVWAYAKRLSDDTRSPIKREAIKAIRETDADITELWNRLRYEGDPKRRALTEKVIDRIIEGCLREIDKLQGRAQ